MKSNNKSKLKPIDNKAVSHPIEFFIAFTLILVGIIFALFATNQFFVTQEPEVEQKDHLIKAMILSDRIINDPGEWEVDSASGQVNNVKYFGLAYQNPETNEYDYGVLDASKVDRLSDKDPGENYLNYTEVKQALGLKDYEFNFHISPGTAGDTDFKFGHEFTNTLTTSTVSRNIFIYNETRDIAEPATLFVTVSKQGGVSSFNEDPVAIDQNLATDENSDIVITLNATDPDIFDELTFTIDTLPTKGTLKFGGAAISEGFNFSGNTYLAGDFSDRPSITYDPFTYGDADSFEFTVDDGYEGADSGTITIDVDYVERCIAADYEIIVSNDQSKDVNVLTDADYHPGHLLDDVTLYVDDASFNQGGLINANNGVVSLVSDSTLRYDPDDDLTDAGEFVSDEFEYILFDQTHGTQDIGLITVTICPADGWYCHPTEASIRQYRDYTINETAKTCPYVVTQEVNCNDTKPADGWTDTDPLQTQQVPDVGCCDKEQKLQEYLIWTATCNEPTSPCNYESTRDTSQGNNGYQWVDTGVTIANDGYCGEWVLNYTSTETVGECLDVLTEHWEWRDYTCDLSTCSCGDPYVVNESSKYTVEIDETPNDDKCSADGWYDTGDPNRWVAGTGCCEKEQKEQEYRNYYCTAEGACTFNIDTSMGTNGYQWVDTGNTRDVDSKCSADGWYDTGDPNRWVAGTGCCEKEQKEQEYRDYSCSACSCGYVIDTSMGTNGYQWVDTGNTRNVDSLCSSDGWYDTGNTQWVAGTGCCEKEQKEQKYRDYSCSGCSCGYVITSTQIYQNTKNIILNTRWVDTGNTRDVDSLCSAGDSCVNCVCVCAPDCSGKACGPDGCGGSCGTCPVNYYCSVGSCIYDPPCTPNCAGKECGSDGCGGSCGSCSSDETCDSGTCVGPSCPPGGTESCNCCSGSDTRSYIYNLMCTQSSSGGGMTCVCHKIYLDGCDCKGPGDSCGGLPCYPNPVTCFYNSRCFCACPTCGSSADDSCCLPVGTMITMADGSMKQIEDIEIGDQVLSFDDQNEKNAVTNVNLKLIVERDGIFSINNGRLIISKDHPIQVQKPDGELVWAAVDPIDAMKSYAWMKDIKKLEIGDKMIQQDNSLVNIYSIAPEFTGEINTYTIGVDSYENYFANGLKVHNADAGDYVSTTCCFPAGTLITMADGTMKQIEDVKIGESVLSYNTDKNKFTNGEVLDLVSPVKTIYSINNGIIKPTSDHPFYVKKSDGRIGWAAINPEISEMGYGVKPMKLEVGDMIFNENGQWIKIYSIEHQSGLLQTFNLKDVSGESNFFANGLLVHNGTSCHNSTVPDDDTCDGGSLDLGGATGGGTSLA
jgi:hypothetical protein